jgi:hypothetical protein
MLPTSAGQPCPCPCPLNARRLIRRSVPQSTCTQRFRLEHSPKLLSLSLQHRTVLYFLLNLSMRCAGKRVGRRWELLAQPFRWLPPCRTPPLPLVCQATRLFGPLLRIASPAPISKRGRREPPSQNPETPSLSRRQQKHIFHCSNIDELQADAHNSSCTPTSYIGYSKLNRQLSKLPFRFSGPSWTGRRGLTPE